MRNKALTKPFQILGVWRFDVQHRLEVEPKTNIVSLITGTSCGFSPFKFGGDRGSSK
jgi:hypothetical protein